METGKDARASVSWPQRRGNPRAWASSSLPQSDPLAAVPPTLSSSGAWPWASDEMTDTVAAPRRSSASGASGSAAHMQERRGHRRAWSTSTARRPKLPLATVTATDETVISPLPSGCPEARSRRSGSLSGGARIKLRPRHRRDSQGTGSLDLSKSRAENEDMGVYTSLESSNLSPAEGGRHGHRRTTSIVSQTSLGSSASPRLGVTPFVHPMRQTPQSFTPPITLPPSEDAQTAEDDYDHEVFLTASLFSPSSLSQPHTSLRRLSTTVAAQGLSLTSQTPLTPSSPVISAWSPQPNSPQSTPSTGRSSIDSMFCRHKETVPVDSVEYRKMVQQLRQEYFERQRVKDAKYEAKAAKAQAKKARKEAARQRKQRGHGHKKVEPVINEGIDSSDGDEVDHGSHHETCIFPSFENDTTQAVSPNPAGTITPIEKTHDTDDAQSDDIHSLATPAAKPKSIRRATRAASHTWHRFKFDCTTLWIHSMRSVGLRARD